MIRIGKSAGKGRGVFATCRIPRGTCIEEAPVVVVPKKELKHLDATALGSYYFEWGEDDEHGALVLGKCQLCNHSYKPNARYKEGARQETLRFIALRDIARGTEITINYGGYPASRDKVWFKVRG